MPLNLFIRRGHIVILRTFVSLLLVSSDVLLQDGDHFVSTSGHRVAAIRVNIHVTSPSLHARTCAQRKYVISMCKYLCCHYTCVAYQMFAYYPLHWGSMCKYFCSHYTCVSNVCLLPVTLGNNSFSSNTNFI